MTEEKFDNTLVERARKAKAALESATDHMNSVLDSCNEIMRSLNLGITSSVDLEDEGEPNVWKLAFVHYEGQWQFVVARPDKWSETVRPVMSASRARRLLVLRVMPKLWDVILEGAEERSTELEAGIAKLELFLDTWKKMK